MAVEYNKRTHRCASLRSADVGQTAAEGEEWEAVGEAAERLKYDVCRSFDYELVCGDETLRRGLWVFRRGGR